jgi:lipopolysaccharide export system protein LptA
MKSLIAMAAPVALAAALAAVLAAQPAAALSAPAQPAAAQPAGGQPTKSSKSPMDVTADHMETHNADCIVVFTGSAEALQDASRLRADVMTAHLEVQKDKPKSGSTTGASSNTCGDMTTLDAKGNVYYASADGRRVHGDNAFYDAATTTVTITGDVTAVDGQNVMRGTKMVYNTDTGEGHVEGGGAGPGAKNRPRGVFYPKDSSTQGDQGAQPDKTQTNKKKKAAQ